MSDSPSRTNRGALHFYGSAEYEERALNSLKIHQPSVMLPKFVLAFIQHLVRSGALYPASQSRLDAAVGKHFGDSFAFSHLQTVLDLFKFEVKDKADRVNIIHAAFLSVILALRALFGVEGSFRLWCAIYEAALSGVEVEFPDGSEPVATLRLVDEQESPGWDAEFTTYPLYVVRELEESRDHQKAMTYWQQAVAMPETSYPRVAMRGFMTLTHEMGDGRQRRIDGYGDIYHSIAFEVANKNRSSLLQDPDLLNPQTSQLRALFGESVADPEKARAWYGAISSLQRTDLNAVPTYPVKGRSISQLQTLFPVQRYKAVRPGGPRHTGLDLPGNPGEEIVAMYSGEVVDAQGDWEDPNDPRGNFVIIRSYLPPKKGGGAPDSFLHEYYHLRDVAVKRGDRVVGGEVIATMGSTGNSTGEHLHLNTRWNKASKSGRTEKRITIDPARVLTAGAVQAALEGGHSFGSPDRPHLAIPLYILSTISGGSYASPVPMAISDHYTQSLKATLADSIKSNPSEPQGEPVPQGGLTSGQKEELKAQARRATPGVLGVSLTAALVAAGVPPEVASAAGSALKTVLARNPQGEPAEISASFKASAPEWGRPLDEVEPAVAHALNWLSQNL
tara:strand:- start:376 stop:2229 length:1854 start_codon:yes stop_codon:yes gene_type:complete